MDGAVLFELGIAEARASLPSAPETLLRAVDVSTDPHGKALAALECGRTLMLAGRPEEGIAVRARIIEELRDHPQLAGMLESEQLINAHAAGSIRDRLLESTDIASPGGLVQTG